MSGSRTRWGGASSATEVAEGGEQGVLRLSGEALDRDLPESRARLLHLAQVRLTAGTERQVLLETTHGVLVEGILEVLGDQLDEVLAGEVGHLTSPARSRDPARGTAPAGCAPLPGPDAGGHAGWGPR